MDNENEKTGHQVRFEYIPDTLQRTFGRLSRGLKLKRWTMRAVIENNRTSPILSHHNSESVRRKSSGGRRTDSSGHAVVSCVSEIVVAVMSVTPSMKRRRVI